MLVLAAESSGSAGLGSLLFPLVLLVGLYLLLIRPARVRARQLAQVQANLVPGARVITTAGLHATVTSVDDDTVLLEIAPGVQARFAGQAVVKVLSEPDTAAAPDEPAP